MVMGFELVRQIVELWKELYSGDTAFLQFNNTNIRMEGYTNGYINYLNLAFNEPFKLDKIVCFSVEEQVYVYFLLRTRMLTSVCEYLNGIFSYNV